MSKFYIILLALSISTILSSQCPNSSEILLRSQSAIEQYIDEFPNCEEFDGTLTIGHFGQPISTDIKDISGLSSFKRVLGTVRIRNCDSLVSLEGLHNLEYIGRDLVIGANDLLRNLDQLEKLDTINEIFEVYDNPVLDTLFSSDQIKHIGESIEFFRNPALRQINGLGNITSLTDFVYIADNDVLESFSGLSNLTSIGGDVDILSNINIPDLTGFDNVTQIGGILSIFGMTIIDLNGLNNLKTVGENLRITGNPNLESLEGLPSLDSIYGALEIIECPNLRSIVSLDNLKFIGSRLNISETGLSDLSGLGNTAPLNNRLTIEDNPELISIAQIRLDSVMSSSVNINDNVKLTDISPLMDVDTIGNGLRLTDNLFLTDCSSLCPSLTDGEISSIISIRGNGPGCTSQDEILTVSCISNTFEEYLNLNIQYFPNPAIDKIQITADYPIDGVTLFTIEGKAVKIEKSHTSSNDVVLQLSDLKQGFYFLQIKSKNLSHIGRFMKL